MQDRRTLIASGKLPGAVPDGSNAQALDVLFSKNDGSELVIIHGLTNWPDAGWTPIGIVVVPGTHNRYEDGSCGIMSLVEMDYNHPETGVSVISTSLVDSIGMYQGFRNDGNYSLDNNYHGCFGYALGYMSACNVPYQTNSTSTDCSIVVSSMSAEWPYVGGNGTPITDLASTEYSNRNGYTWDHFEGSLGFCDFNGIRNTAAAYMWSRNMAPWVGSVSNLTYHFPAYVCSGRFKTIGTNSFIDVYSGISAGNLAYGTIHNTLKPNVYLWYFPAAGELCYILRYRFEINKIILAINQKYGNIGTLLNNNEDQWYLSSTVDSNGRDPYSIYMYNGTLNNRSAYYDDMHVRAFLRFKTSLTREPISETVDLSLPSGLLWRKYNVGTSYETGYGNFYMYGAGANTFDYSVTPYAGTENPLSSSYDTATLALGSEWRMPTEAEVTELINNTNYEWTTVNGVTGAKFTSKTDYTKYIFFPASGYYYNGNYEAEGSEACIWTATPGDSNKIKYLSLESSGPSIGNIKRSCGFAVRGVKASS